jgi:hypothetical protein
MIVAGAMGVVAAGYLAISAIIGPFTWVAIFIVLTLVAMIKLATRSAADAVTERRVKEGPSRGVVDCAGESLRIGDTVRAGTGFDGPMEWPSVRAWS